MIIISHPLSVSNQGFPRLSAICRTGGELREVEIVMPKITKRTVDAIQATPKRYTIWDSQLVGFGVIVRPSGVYSYIYSYRNQNNRKRSITIGKVGTMTPDEARRKADEHRRSVLDGHDPMAEKREAKKHTTVSGLLDAYIESPTFTEKAESTRYTDLGRIERHLRPLLGRIPIVELDLPTVERAHRAIIHGKTACNRRSGKLRGRTQVKGGEGTARAAIRLLRAILGWGYKSGLVSQSALDAARHVNIGRDGKRTIILEDAAQYAMLWATLDRLVDPSQLLRNEVLLRPQVADAIKVLALTGARRGEITALKWKHVDLEKGIIELPPSVHKTGRKTGEARIIGLPDLAKKIINQQGVRVPDDFVFRATKPGSEISISKQWRAIRSAAGLPDGIGLHGLRHSLASHMAMQGAEAAEIMTALGHKDISTTQRYIHWAKDQRQVLAERAASGIVSAVSSKNGIN